MEVNADQKAKVNTGDIDPSPIMQMTSAYWVSQALNVAVKLRVFTVLEGKSLRVEEVARLIKAPSGSAERLLNACCALGLLQKENGRYRNTPISDRFLTEEKEGYLGYLANHMDQLYPNWGKLAESVKENKPVHDRFGDGVKISEKEARFFTLAMHSSSSMTAPFLADTVNLSGNKKLLDIGGGSGANAMALAEKNPGLEAVVYDFPAVIKVADEFITKSKAANRVKTKAGDYNKDDLPKGFDCMLLSHILHAEGENGSRLLLKKCYDALEPSGKIIIAEFLLNENKTGPVFPALFALNMLVETAEGNAFSGQEIIRFLKDTGFKVEGVKPLGGSQVTVVVATKTSP